MAKAYSPPAGYEYHYDYSNFDRDACTKSEEDYIERLRKYCKDNTDSRSNLVGETIEFQVADGYAVYMIFTTSPLQLIHVPIVDAYQVDACTIRGLRVKDIKDKLKWKKKMKSMFSAQTS
jgi:hypothetical protein